MSDVIYFLQDKFKFFDKHHVIERFTVLSVLFSSVLLILYGISFKMHIDRGRINLTTQAKYTPATRWNITGNKIEILDIYRNSDTTKSFVLLKSDGLAGMSTDAADYNMFVTGYKGDKLTDELKGAVYLFGNTGYIGLYFADADGIDPHMYQITLASYNMLTSFVDEAELEKAEEDRSTFNSCTFFANLAGSDAIVADVLERNDFSIVDLYMDVILDEEESDDRAKLRDTLVAMSNNMNMIANYEKELTTYNIVIPELPIQISGDFITTNADEAMNKPVNFDRDTMLPINSGVITSSYGYDTVGASESVKGIAHGVAVSDEPIYLATDYVFPSGIEFNWQDSILNDYVLSSLHDETMSDDLWIKKKKEEKNVYPDLCKFNADVYFDWCYKDGTKFEMSEYNSTDTLIAQTIANYEKAVTDLCNLKFDYQAHQLVDLLGLELRARTAVNMFSINAEDDVLQMY